MLLLPPGSECEKRNPKKLKKVAFSHFFDTLRRPFQAALLMHQSFMLKYSASLSLHSISFSFIWACLAVISSLPLLSLSA